MSSRFKISFVILTKEIICKKFLGWKVDDNRWDLEFNDDQKARKKNVGTRFYLVIVRKHTKVKHFAFVASLSVFSYVWLCKFDQTITMLDDDNGWLPLFRNKIFLRKRSHVHILLLYSKLLFTFEPIKMSVCKLV